MLDLGWPEILVIGAIAVLVIGPQDIPKIMYAVGRFFRRLQYVKFAISQQFDEVLKAGDIEELRKGVNMEVRDPERDGAPKKLPEEKSNDGNG